MTSRTIAALGTLAMLSACGAPRVPAPEPRIEQTIVEAGASKSFDVRLPPGTWLTINFVQSPSLREAAEVIAEYSTPGDGQIVAGLFAHPRRDLTVQTRPEGQIGVHVSCPGVEHHPVRGAVALPTRTAALVARANELAHFGFAFRADPTDVADLRVTLRAVGSSVMVTGVRMLPLPALTLPPDRPGDGTPLQSAAPSAE